MERTLYIIIDKDDTEPPHKKEESLSQFAERIWERRRKEWLKECSSQKEK